MVGKDHELPTFYKVAKMSYRLINRQEFFIKRTVSLLNSLKLLRVVRDRAPLSSNFVYCKTAPTAVSKASHIMAIAEHLASGRITMYHWPRPSC